MISSQNTQLDRFLPVREVLRVLGVSKTTLYDMMTEGEFPRGIRITKKRVGWRESVVKRWMESVENRP
jgi:prophage regulatory protein